MAAAVSACGHRASQQADDGGKTTADTAAVAGASASGDTATADSASRPALTLDTISIERNSAKAEVSVSVQWPTAGPEALVKSVRGFILDVCGIQNKAFKGSKADWRDMVDTEYNGLEESWNGTYADAEDGGPSFSSAMEVRLLAETAGFVTFYGETSSYSGGAHGMALHIGRTFRKSDGRLIGYETEYDEQSMQMRTKDGNLLRDTESARFRALLKAGVMRYFKDCGQEMADEAELAGFLQVDDVDRIPLPGNAPYLTTSGVVFCYTQYEIAPYAAGMITFEIPYQDIGPFLTAEAKALVP